jgi:hypothetical protein
MSILLAQHKAELGNKEIYQVNVVSDSKSIKPFAVTELHLFFQIRDVPPIPKESGEEKPTTDKLAGSKTSSTNVSRHIHRTISSQADNIVLSVTRDVISIQELSASLEITEDED